MNIKRLSRVLAIVFMLNTAGMAFANAAVDWMNQHRYVTVGAAVCTGVIVWKLVHDAQQKQQKIKEEQAKKEAQKKEAKEKQEQEQAAHKARMIQRQKQEAQRKAAAQKRRQARMTCKGGRCRLRR